MTTQGAVRALSDLRAFIENEAGLKAIARETISGAEGRAAEAGEIEALAKDLRAQLKGLVDQLDAGPSQLGEIQDGLLKMDLVGLAFLRTFGEAGKMRAGELEDSARVDARRYERSPQKFSDIVWCRWYRASESRPPFAGILAAALWWDHVRYAVPEPVEESQVAPKSAVLREKSAAISATVLRRVAQVFFWRDLPKVFAAGEQVQLVGEGGELLGVSPVVRDPRRLKQILKSTRSVLGHRLFRHLAIAGVTTNSRVLEVEGGLTGLAKTLEARSKKAPSQLREILGAFSQVMVQLPHGQADALLTWSLTPEAPRMPAILRIIPHDLFRPDYVVTLPKTTRTQRAGRRLCSVPNAPPPLLGGPRGHAAQWTLQELFALEMSERAEEIYKNDGWIRMPRERWEAIGDAAGLDRELLPDVLGQWLADGFLLQHPTDHDFFTAEGWAPVHLAYETGLRAAKGRARQARAKHK